jgi:hypothetical protein
MSALCGLQCDTIVVLSLPQEAKPMRKLCLLLSIVAAGLTLQADADQRDNVYTLVFDDTLVFTNSSDWVGYEIAPPMNTGIPATALPQPANPSNPPR